MRIDAVRRGLTLLEVLVALVLVGLVAAGWATLLGQGTHSVRAARAREAEIHAASDQLDRMLASSQRQLTGRLGTVRAHGLVVTVGEIAPALFSVGITDTLRGAPLLA